MQGLKCSKNSTMEVFTSQVESTLFECREQLDADSADLLNNTVIDGETDDDDDSYGDNLLQLLECLNEMCMVFERKLYTCR